MRKSLVIALCVIPLIGLLTSCIKVISNKNITSVDQLGPDQVLLVGKIELKPKLGKHDQYTTKRGASAYINRAYILIGKTSHNLYDLSRKSIRDTYAVELGKHFFIPVNREDALYYSGGIIVMDDRINSANGLFTAGIISIRSAIRNDHMKLPGTIKIKNPDDAKALYIGTIRYQRDEFLDIKKVDVINQYKKANNVFQNKYKTRISLAQ